MPRMPSRNHLLVCLLATVQLTTACAKTVHERHLYSHRAVPVRTQTKSDLKVHLHSGQLIVLETWRETDAALNGRGTLYGIDRGLLRTETFAIPFDSIALLETSSTKPVRPAGLTVLAVWTGLIGTVTGLCVADPKSCFGSCPTFYVNDGTGEVLQAEGFSASIARVLEARDVDALYRARPAGSRFSLRMTNEALETHAVRTVRVLAVPRPAGARIFATSDGRYYPASETLAPLRCTGPEGDCLAPLAGMDTLERYSLADSTNLATRETLELEFPSVTGRLGIVIGARHSLVSTFLFYQTIAFFGQRAGDWMAALERSTPEEAAKVMGMARLLGGIDVEVEDGTGTWRSIGSYDEAGPIATDVAVLPFVRERADSAVRVRLHLAQGAWRVNYVALVRLGEPVTAIVLEPESVQRESAEDPHALASLRDPDRYLVTYPGDEYRLGFTLPESPYELELFLESQGYYYEWMRAEWLEEENPVMAAIVLHQPEEALRQLAPRFKRIESEMERLFWESRFGR